MSLDVNVTDTIEAVNRNQWNQVVEQSDLGRVYHRYGWLRALEAGTSAEPKHLFVSKNENPIAIFPNFVMESDRLPVRHLSSPKPGPTGPVATADEEEAIQLLLDAVSEVTAGATVSNQIQTAGPEFSRYHELLAENGYEQKFVYCDFVLDITREWEDLLADMDSSRRWAIRKATETEHEIVEKEITEESMAAFYDGFSSVMDRVGGRKTPRQFFVELSEFAERLKLLTLRAEGGERGTILLTLDDERSTVHCESAAITEDQFEYNPSELLHEYAIKWGQENGYQTYNFGGTDPDFRDGLFRFKQKFGAQPRPALTWECGCSPLRWPAYKLGRWLYQQVDTDSGGL